MTTRRSQPMLEVAIAALGNRAWGHSPAFKPVGVAMSTFAFLFAFPHLWHLSVWVAALVWLGRVFSTRPLHVPSKDWSLALIRTYAWIPLFVFITWATGDQWRLLFAMACPSIVLMYWLDERYSKFERLVLAELAVGTYIGLSLVRL